jgi:hypothetical protein
MSLKLYGLFQQPLMPGLSQGQSAKVEATADADPYEMTTKRTGNNNGNSDSKDKCGDPSLCSG